MSQLWQIIYPRGDRTRLTVGLVWDYEQREYDLVSPERFDEKEDAKDLARRLAAQYGLRLDADEFEMPAYLDDQNEDYKALIGQVRATIRDYHFALDQRQHAGTAHDVALSEIMRVLGMLWKPGAETERRENKTLPFRQFET